MNLEDIVDGTVNTLTASLSDTRVIAGWADVPLPPCIMVFPRPFTYAATFDPNHQLELTCWCLTQFAMADGAQRTMLRWLSDTGTESIYAAIKADPTLAGTVSSAEVIRVESYEPVLAPDGATRWLAAEVIVWVYT